jgi:hypothetical protein
MKISVGNMPPIFPQMEGNAIGPTHFGQCSSPYGVRLVGLPRLANRGDMIDIDA